MEQDADPVTGTLRDVWGTGPDDVYAVGAGGTVLHFAGRKPSGFDWWIKINTGITSTVWDAWGSGKRDIFFVGQDPSPYHFDGKNLTKLTKSANKSANGVWGFNKGPIFVASVDGKILRTNRAAWPNSWALETTPSGIGHLMSIWGSSAGHVIAVGYDGDILGYDGTAWKQMISPTTELPAAAAGDSTAAAGAV